MFLLILFLFPFRLILHEGRSLLGVESVDFRRPLRDSLHSYKNSFTKIWNRRFLYF